MYFNSGGGGFDDEDGFDNSESGNRLDSNIGHDDFDDMDDDPDTYVANYNSDFENYEDDGFDAPGSGGDLGNVAAGGADDDDLDNGEIFRNSPSPSALNTGFDSDEEYDFGYWNEEDAPIGDDDVFRCGQSEADAFLFPDSREVRIAVSTFSFFLVYLGKFAKRVFVGLG